MVLCTYVCPRVLHFRKTRVKSKNSNVENKTSAAEFKSEAESPQKMGSRKLSQAEFHTDSSDKVEEADN